LVVRMRMATTVGLQKSKICDVWLRERPLCTSTIHNVGLFHKALTITRSKRLE